MYSNWAILLVILNRTTWSIELCNPENYVDISEGTHFSNGDIYFDGVKFNKTEYLVDAVTGAKKGCLCKKHTCVRKCCPLGQGYNGVTKVCEVVSEEFAPPVWDEYNLIGGVKATDIFRFSYGSINCTEPEIRVRLGKVYTDYHLRADGQLFIESPETIPSWKIRGPDKYCLDTFVFEDDMGNRTAQLDALVCFEDEEIDFDPTGYIISSSGMLISCVFILATLAVYSWLPELRNLHGRVLMAYLCCLFVGFLSFATMQILLLLEKTTVHMCLGLTFIIYFSLLSAFFWLNVMSFDIWWTFSGKRGTSLERLSARGRFCAYALYAFGVPSALTFVVAALEFSGLNHHLLPNIELQGCFLYGKSKIIYFYGPVAVLCIANCIFFILTAVRIARIKQQTAVLQSKESATHDTHRNDRQRLLLYVKLFAVMGINWLLEVISGIYPAPAAVWRYTDAYNVLIGLTIFLIFVCKKKTFRLIKKRYHQLRGDPISRTQTTSSRVGSSTNDMKMTTVSPHNTPGY